MELTFSNGSAEQQALWQEAYGFLLNLPMEQVGLDITVTFADPSEVGQTGFAATTWTYGSAVSTTLVRDDAPGFGGADAGLIAEAARLGLTYNANQHFHETASHELGHSFFAALPEEKRLAIVALFGLDSDDVSVLFPEGAAWQDMPGEAIAETFKEAFLPRRYRVFPNRTNISIPYAKFPEFRNLFRLGNAEVGGGGGEEEEGEETTLPELDEDAFAQGHTQEEPEEPEFEQARLLPGTEGRDGIWESLYQNLIFTLGHDAEIRAASEWSGWVKDGTVLTYTFDVDPAYFIDAPYEIKGEIAPTNRWHDFRLIWELFKKSALGPEYEPLHFAEWAKTLSKPGELPGVYSGGFRMAGLAEGGGAPHTTFSADIHVNAENFDETKECGGELYRFVVLRAQPTVVLTVQHPFTEAEVEALRQAAAYPWYPTLVIKQAPCGGGGGGGPILEAPSSTVEPGGHQGGVRPKPGRIIGGRTS